MIYASKTPRDLNHDTKPYVDGHVDTAGYGRRFSDPYPTPGHCQACGTRYDPRPEYDHAQHNEPNPILVGFRESHENEREYLTRIDTHGLPLWVKRPSDFRHVMHARRVLTRLASLRGAS